jgi:hypothetical protein
MRRFGLFLCLSLSGCRQTALRQCEAFANGYITCTALLWTRSLTDCLETKTDFERHVSANRSVWLLCQ